MRCRVLVRGADASVLVARRFVLLVLDAIAVGVVLVGHSVSVESVVGEVGNPVAIVVPETVCCIGESHRELVIRGDRDPSRRSSRRTQGSTWSCAHATAGQAPSESTRCGSCDGEPPHRVEEAAAGDQGSVLNDPGHPLVELSHHRQRVAEGRDDVEDRVAIQLSG